MAKNKTVEQLQKEYLAAKREEELKFQEMKDDFRIGIRFGDNDFYYTFIGILTNIDKAIEAGRSYKGGLLSISKAKWVELINEMALSSYYLWQNQFAYTNGATHEEHRERTREYLKVKPNRILLNESLDAYLEKTEGDNGETFILDRRLGEHRIYSR